MCRHGTPCLRTSSATKCGVISSRRFPRWTGPDGLIPDAHVGGSPGCLRIASARTSPAVRTTQSSAAATGQDTSIVFSAAISVPVRAGRPSAMKPRIQCVLAPWIRGFTALARRLALRRGGLQLAAVPGGQDDLGYQVGAQAELLRDL